MEALEDLSDSQLKKFRYQLTDRREEPRVRRGAVQNADYMDLADIMVSTFTEAGVIKVAVDLLKTIGCNDIATDLEKSLRSKFNHRILRGKTNRLSYRLSLLMGD